MKAEFELPITTTSGRKTSIFIHGEITDDFEEERIKEIGEPIIRREIKDCAPASVSCEECGNCLDKGCLWNGYTEEGEDE